MFWKLPKAYVFPLGLVETWQLCKKLFLIFSTKKHRLFHYSKQKIHLEPINIFISLSDVGITGLQVKKRYSIYNKLHALVVPYQVM